MFDHHEDVAVLDAESSPKTIKAYQIKTKDTGNWTLKGLAKQEKGEGNPPQDLPSILGKLYHLKREFPDDVVLLQFVSNAHVSVKLSSTGKTCYDSTHTSYEDLHNDSQVFIREQLKKEFQLANHPELNKLLEFSVPELPLRSHMTFVKGKLAEFLGSLLPNKAIRQDALYRALISEVNVRNNNADEIATFEDLLANKSISKSRFETILSNAGVTKTNIEATDVIARLNSEQAPFGLIKQIEAEWDQVSTDRLLKTDRTSLMVWDRIRKSCKSVEDEERLVNRIDKVFEESGAMAMAAWTASTGYVKTCIAMAAYEY